MSDDSRPPEVTGAGQQAAGAGQRASDASQQAADTRQQDEKRQNEERQRLIFKNDLNQVYLLLSFISGRPERNLYGLTMPDPDDPGKQWGYGKIVQEPMKIQYPPRGPEEAIAEQATVLLLAKDRLSQMAWPARSETIAYTAMYAEEMRRSFWTRLWSGLSALWRKPAGSPVTASPAMAEASLGRLARDTFPHFEDHVRRFFIFRNFLFYAGALLLFLTAQTSWDVAHGRDVLGRIDQLNKDWNTTVQANVRLLDPGFCQAIQPIPFPSDGAGRAAPAPNTVDADGAATTGKTGDQNGNAGWLGCVQLANITSAREQAYSDVDRIFGCDGASCTHFSSHALYWGWLLSGRPEPVNPSSDTAAGKEPPRPVISSLLANSVLTVFSGYILPLFYGLLGTIVGAFRSIQDKVRNGELGPRDLGLTFTGMMLGSVAGLVVGILMSPDSIAAGTGNALGNVTLTASGLAFLAGYASQSFFRFLDGVIAKIFPADIPETPANVAGSPLNPQLSGVREGASR